MSTRHGASTQKMNVGDKRDEDFRCLGATTFTARWAWSVDWFSHELNHFETIETAKRVLFHPNIGDILATITLGLFNK